jgi:nucleoside-diphosphate-sugar epimerase
MIYFGSTSEYGKVKTEMKETDFCNPETLYAATKTCGTVLAQSYARTYDKDICVVRPFSIYGVFEPEHRLVPTLYRKITNGEEVSLIEGYHDFFYIEDFTNLIELVLNSEKEKTKADILNAGSGISYSNLEIAHIFSKVLDKDLKCVLLDKVKECDSPVWKADVTHILQKYNFKSNFTLEKGLLYYKIYQDEHFTRYTGI